MNLREVLILIAMAMVGMPVDARYLPSLFNLGKNMSKREWHWQEDHGPIIRQAIPELSVCVGSRLTYTIPPDTFYDYEAGNTENLKLYVFASDLIPLQSYNWMHFDDYTQTLHGIPSTRDVGMQRYLVVAVDMNGGAAKMWVKVRVLPSTNALCNKRR